MPPFFAFCGASVGWCRVASTSCTMGGAKKLEVTVAKKPAAAMRNRSISSGKTFGTSRTAAVTMHPGQRSLTRGDYSESVPLQKEEDVKFSPEVLPASSRSRSSSRGRNPRVVAADVKSRQQSLARSEKSEIVSEREKEEVQESPVTATPPVAAGSRSSSRGKQPPSAMISRQQSRSEKLSEAAVEREEAEDKFGYENRRDSQVSTASAETMERRRRLDHRNSEIQIEEILERVFLDVTSPQTACCDVQIPSRVTHARKMFPPVAVNPAAKKPSLPAMPTRVKRSIVPLPKQAPIRNVTTAAGKKPNSSPATSPTVTPKAATPSPRSSIAKPPSKATSVPFARPSTVSKADVTSANRVSLASATKKPAVASDAAARTAGKISSSIPRTTSKLPQHVQKTNDSKPIQGTEDALAKPFVVECQSEVVTVQAHRVEKISTVKVTAKVAAPSSPAQPQITKIQPKSNGNATGVTNKTDTAVKKTASAAAPSVRPSTKGGTTVTRGAPTSAIAARGDLGTVAAASAPRTNSGIRGGKRA